MEQETELSQFLFVCWLYFVDKVQLLFLFIRLALLNKWNSDSNLEFQAAVVFSTPHREGKYL